MIVLQKSHHFVSTNILGDLTPMTWYLPWNSKLKITWFYKREVCSAEISVTYKTNILQSFSCLLYELSVQSSLYSRRLNQS